MYFIKPVLSVLKSSCLLLVSVSQTEILQESQMMIPDCQRRLGAAHADLTQLLVSVAQTFYLKICVLSALWLQRLGLHSFIGGIGLAILAYRVIIA